MQKIGSITSTANASGEWTNGNVAAGTPPTIIDAAWLNTVQREISNVVTNAGLSLDPENDAQLLAAIKLLTGPGRLLNVKIFTASGSYTPTTGTAKIRVRQVGGGGAGGGTLSTSGVQIASGNGGNGGTYGDTGLMAVPTSSVAVVVGSAGMAVVGGNGGSGGNTSFGAYLISPGGSGGGAGSAGGAGTLSSDPAPSGNSTGTNVFFTKPGVPGTGAFNITAASSGIKSGGGGNSEFGIGGGGINGTTTPRAGVGYGAGGGGNAAGPNASSNIAGANGTSGICFIEEYA